MFPTSVVHICLSERYRAVWLQRRDEDLVGAFGSDASPGEEDNEWKVLKDTEQYGYGEDDGDSRDISQMVFFITEF